MRRVARAAITLLTWGVCITTAGRESSRAAMKRGWVEAHRFAAGAMCPRLAPLRPALYIPSLAATPRTRWHIPNTLLTCYDAGASSLGFSDSSLGGSF